MRKLLAASIVVATLVLGSTSAASAAVLDGDYATQGGSGFAWELGDPPLVTFTVENGVIVKGVFAWTTTCVHSLHGSSQQPAGGDLQDPPFADGPYPIAANGHFRIEVTESGVAQLQPPPAPGYPYSTTTVVEGTVDGSNASGTVSYVSDQQDPNSPPHSQHCEGGGSWSAQRLPDPQDCADAREKVSKLKQKLQNAEGSKKKSIKKKLKKAKAEKQEACS